MHLVLVRHGAIDVAPGLCIGHADVPLSTAGRDAVAALAASWDLGSLATPTRIACSDLRRARASAEPFAERFALAPVCDARYRELDFGAWDGRAWAEIGAAEPRALQAWSDAWLTDAPPGGESVPQLVERVRGGLRDLTAHADDDEVQLVVSHAGWIRAALCVLLDEPPARLFDRAIDYASATIVRVERDAPPRLIAVNAARVSRAAAC